MNSNEQNDVQRGSTPSPITCEVLLVVPSLLWCLTSGLDWTTALGYMGTISLFLSAECGVVAILPRPSVITINRITRLVTISNSIQPDQVIYHT